MQGQYLKDVKRNKQSTNKQSNKSNNTIKTIIISVDCKTIQKTGLRISHSDSAIRQFF
jgi:hypothetical protein